MSVSPLQNFLNPPPLPETPTVTRTLPPVRIPNSSATASLTGNTVLEPSMVMLPSRFIIISLPPDDVSCLDAVEEVSVLGWVMACCEPAEGVLPDILWAGCSWPVVAVWGWAAGSDPPQAREKRASISRTGVKIVAASRRFLWLVFMLVLPQT